MAESTGTEPPQETLGKSFLKFANFGNHSKTEKRTLSDKNVTKMFKDFKLYGKSLTSVDTDIAFSKVKEKGNREITMAQFNDLLKAVATKYQKDKGLDSAEAAYKELTQLITENGPLLQGTTTAIKRGGVERLTDHTQYTGTHKERFDETGKGKGIAGREEVDANDGYVQGYKEKGTFEKKVATP